MKKNLVRTIMGVISEENRERASGDKRTKEEMEEIREELEQMDSGTLQNYWFLWVGEWLLSRSEDYCIHRQFFKTLKGEQDYGFT